MKNCKSICAIIALLAFFAAGAAIIYCLINYPKQTSVFYVACAIYVAVEMKKAPLLEEKIEQL